MRNFAVACRYAEIVAFAARKPDYIRPGGICRLLADELAVDGGICSPPAQPVFDCGAFGIGLLPLERSALACSLRKRDDIGCGRFLIGSFVAARRFAVIGLLFAARRFAVIGRLFAARRFAVVGLLFAARRFAVVGRLVTADGRANI